MAMSRDTAGRVGHVIKCLPLPREPVSIEAFCFSFIPDAKGKG